MAKDEVCPEGFNKVIENIKKKKLAKPFTVTWEDELDGKVKLKQKCKVD
jgi:hypothetical protein